MTIKWYKLHSIENFLGHKVVDIIRLTSPMDVITCCLLEHDYVTSDPHHVAGHLAIGGTSLCYIFFGNQLIPGMT